MGAGLQGLPADFSHGVLFDLLYLYNLTFSRPECQMLLLQLAATGDAPVCKSQETHVLHSVAWYVFGLAASQAQILEQRRLGPNNF